MFPWQEEMSREGLLATRIQQLERRPEDVELAIERLRQARLKNKENFDKKHHFEKGKLKKEIGFLAMILVLTINIALVESLQNDGLAHLWSRK